MAEGTYEYECMRAELLGVEKPNQEEFEKARAERLEKEKAEQDAAAEAALLESQEEQLKNAGGKFDELNTILSSTQQKLNRFKQTACGSFSNMFARGSVDFTDGGGGASASSSATSSRRNTTAIGGSSSSETVQQPGSIDPKSALENFDEIQQQQFPSSGTQPIIPTEKIRAANLDIQKKMSSHLDKLDSLINKAEHAEISMSEQTKAMRKIAK